MKALYLPIVLVLSSSILTACSSGSSSGGGEDATSCISTSENGVTNNCEFAVNIDAGAGIERIDAGQTITPNGSSIFIAACRAPAVPKDEGSLNFSCEE